MCSQIALKLPAMPLPQLLEFQAYLTTLAFSQCFKALRWVPSPLQPFFLIIATFFIILGSIHLHACIKSHVQFLPWLLISSPDVCFVSTFTVVCCQPLSFRPSCVLTASRSLAFGGRGRYSALRFTSVLSTDHTVSNQDSFLFSAHANRLHIYPCGLPLYFREQWGEGGRGTLVVQGLSLCV